MSAADSRPPETLDSKAARLLVLDDDEAVLVPLVHYFETRGYAVVAAREPEEAEALLDHETFDAVILDLALTRFGHGGLEVLGSIRSRHPWLPVVILSAYISPEVEAEARRLRADAVLGKPRPLRELAALVESLLGKRA